MITLRGFEKRYLLGRFRSVKTDSAKDHEVMYFFKFRLQRDDPNVVEINQMIQTALKIHVVDG